MKDTKRYYKGVWSDRKEAEYYYITSSGYYWWCHPGTEYDVWADGHNTWKARYRSHKLKGPNGKEVMRFYPVERLEIIIVCGKLCPMDGEGK